METCFRTHGFCSREHRKPRFSVGFPASTRNYEELFLRAGISDSRSNQPAGPFLWAVRCKVLSSFVVTHIFVENL
jgi:hypothetical protein